MVHTCHVDAMFSLQLLLQLKLRFFWRLYKI